MLLPAFHLVHAEDNIVVGGEKQRPGLSFRSSGAPSPAVGSVWEQRSLPWRPRTISWCYGERSLKALRVLAQQG